MEESQFDAIIFGTGLVESITAAALSKAGYKVAHIDSNAYYGGDEASLSLEEVVQWADSLIASSSSGPSPSPSTSRFQRVSRSADVPQQSRQYSICLQPAVLPSVGPMIQSLVSSGVSKYSGFRLVDCVSVYDYSSSSSGGGRVKNVPGSKEDIFKSKEISLIEKRRLMRFLTFAAAGEFEGKKELEGKQDMPFLEFLRTGFSLSEEIASVITYALAYCVSPTEPTLPVLNRLQKYLKSSGRYGASPFLIGHYGGIGDIAQGFCRAAAVSGGVYILGRKITSISRAVPPPPLTTPSETDTTDEPAESKPTFNYKVDLEDFPDTLSCNLIISSPSYIPSTLKDEAVQLLSSSQDEFKSGVASIARCIAILDQALALRSSAPEAAATPAETTSEEGQEEQPPVPAVKDTGVDTGILVFPPASVEGGSKTHSATVLINGEGSLSTPKGKWLVYIALPLADDPEVSITAEALLKPYLDAMLSLPVDPSKAPIQPLFTTFYLDKPPSPIPSSGEIVEGSTYLIPPPIPFAILPDLPDESTANAEITFTQAYKALRKIRRLEDDDGEEPLFWPPLPKDDDEEDNEW